MRRRDVVVGLGVAATLALVLAGSVATYRYRWELRGFKARLEGVSPWDLRIGVFDPDATTELYRSGTLRLAALEFHPPGESRAVILLLHGHTPKGSRLAFYRVLGRRLANLGYLVVAPDFAGFGASGDPFSVAYEEGYSGDRDVRAWLDHLTSDPRLSGRPLFIIAHSAGASSGLPVGLKDPRVAGIVAIGPSRKVIEDLSDPEQADYWWRRNQWTHRQVYGREFPDWYTKQRWLSEAVGEGSGVGLKRPMENFLPLLQNPGHHPVLLVDGEREPEDEEVYLQAYYEAMTEPKDYRTLTRSDHYSNVAHVGRWAIYDKAVVDETVEVLDGWMTSVLDSSESPGSKTR